MEKSRSRNHLKTSRRSDLKFPEWPPLICTADVPFWVRARDTILTILAWLVMAYLLRGVALTIVEWTRHEPVLFMSRYFESIHIFWLQLRPFARIAAIMMVWLLFWTFRRRRILTGTQKAEKQPPELDLVTHARARNLPPPLLEKWRTEKIVKINFNEQGDFLY